MDRPTERDSTKVFSRSLRCACRYGLSASAFLPLVHIIECPKACGKTALYNENRTTRKYYRFDHTRTTREADLLPLQEGPQTGVIGGSTQCEISSPYITMGANLFQQAATIPSHLHSSVEVGLIPKGTGNGGDLPQRSSLGPLPAIGSRLPRLRIWSIAISTSPPRISKARAASWNRIHPGTNMPTFFGDYKVGLRGLANASSHSAH